MTQTGMRLWGSLWVCRDGPRTGRAAQLRLVRRRVSGHGALACGRVSRVTRVDLACTLAAGLPVCSALEPVGKVGRDSGRRKPQGPLESPLRLRLDTVTGRALQV